MKVCRSSARRFTRQPTILIIDDDPNNQAIVAGYLESRNFAILAAEDGEIGLKRAEYTLPDLILLDIMMPGIDGYEICRRLKAQESTREIPVIFMTALAETEHKVRGFEAGGVDYITKPFQREEVLARVGVHLQIRELAHSLQEANESLEKRVQERTAELAQANLDLQVEMAERRQTEDQLRQAQKMEAVGTLAGGIAHDFNNILTAIIGYGTIVGMRMEEADPLKKHVDDIVTVAEKAAQLTQSLLSFSRKKTLTTNPENLNDIVQRIDKILQRLIGEDIEVKTELADAQLVIQAEGGQIEQVLMNLATNSRDAMPQGGLLSIKTERVEVTGDFGEPWIEPGSYALITVSDTGHGFDEETKQRIFEPFYTTKEMGKGTGLGLSIVYGIVKQHRGEITVHSVPGQGTTFKIYLKLLARKTEQAKRTLAAPPVGGTETILVAEDDTIVRRFMKDTLTEFGYTVVEAVDGEDAVAQFMRNRDSIDMLILDVVMPKKNGRIAFEEIRQMETDVPVLFTSGYTAEIISSETSLQPGVSFVSKPLNPHLLLGKVREALA